ncbi:ankyrin repeat domain protein [Nitzschia inconspicua]|uniref:Ankyrin repeat domain protein n=2 Tax=Nitzschia inconspicua TaxID=303405 RepID=A0A9K3K7S8_9STRA|nr:ankyrin repeat domain protein [Nitzschia inconspicua]
MFSMNTSRKEPPRISRKRSLCDISYCDNPKVIPVEKPFVRIVSRPTLPKKKNDQPVIKPLIFLKSHLLSLGVEVELQSCQQLHDFFMEPSQAEIDAYGFDLLNAVRNQDLEALEKFHKEGRPLKCSNQFGESLLHLACRKSFAKVVKFLIHDAEVPLNVKDDFGRNPAHDACWTISPNWELMDLIVEQCPDLFFVEDVRGHTPLDYVRMEHWPSWIDYLCEKGEKLTPKQLPFTKHNKP